MKSTDYNVVFHGEIAEGQHLAMVKKRLSSMFKLSKQQIEETFAGKPLLVKDHVDYQTALKYKTAFEKAGTVCQIEPATQTPQPGHARKSERMTTDKQPPDEARALEQWEQEMTEWRRATKFETSGQTCKGHPDVKIEGENVILVFLGYNHTQLKEDFLAQLRNNLPQLPPYICAPSLFGLQQIYPDGRCARCHDTHTQYWKIFYGFDIPKRPGQKMTVEEINAWVPRFNEQINRFDTHNRLDTSTFNWYLSSEDACGSFTFEACNDTRWICWACEAIERAYRSIGGQLPSNVPPPRPHINTSPAPKTALQPTEGWSPGKRYQVIFHGEIVDGYETAKVKRNLARLFKADVKRIEPLFSGQPVIIKDNLDAQTAETYQKKIKEAGAICVIQQRDSAEQSIPPPRKISEEQLQTQLLKAVEDDKPDAIRRLLEQGVRHDSKDENGNTPLHTAALNKHIACCKALIEGGADPYAKNEAGQTPFQYAEEFLKLHASAMGATFRGMMGNFAAQSAREDIEQLRTVLTGKNRTNGGTVTQPEAQGTVQKVPCRNCGAMILPRTAAKNDGLCVPCSRGKNSFVKKQEQGHGAVESGISQKEQEVLNNHDQERCYFCGNYPADTSATIKIPMFRTLSSEEISGGTAIEYKYLPHTLYVPRCQHCKKYHRQHFDAQSEGGGKLALALLLSIVCIIGAICVLTALFGEGTAQVGIIGGVVAIAAGFSAAKLFSKFSEESNAASKQVEKRHKKKHGILPKPFNDYKSYGEYVEAVKFWQIGHSPTSTHVNISDQR